MKILVISNSYPSKKNPTNGIFLYKLIQKFIEQDNKVTVIAPQKIWDLLKENKYYGEEKARVVRPVYISFSAKKMGSFHTYSFGHHSQVMSVRRVIRKNPAEFDIIYCQFIRNAFVAFEASKVLNIPIIADVGEYKGINMTLSWFGREKFGRLLDQINGFVAVSEQVKERLLGLRIPEEKITVEPNGVDFRHFRRLNKHEMRAKYGIPDAEFIVAFTGNFIESKGPDRLIKAIQGLDHVKAIMIGSGPIKLTSEQIVFKGRVPAHQVPELLNCADIFALPTQHEGNNNSILEAMACGLPIVSSDIPEVRSQCNPSFSILVDPNDIVSIRTAIVKLSNDIELRERMSINAIEWSQRFDLNQRAKRIIDYLQSFVNS